MILLDLSPAGLTTLGLGNNRTKLRGGNSIPRLTDYTGRTNTAIHTTDNTHLPDMHHHPTAAGSDDRLHDFTTTAPSIYTSLILLSRQQQYTEGRHGANAAVASGVALQRRSRTGVSDLEEGNRRLVLHPTFFARAFQEGHPVFSFLFASFLCMTFTLFSRSFWLLVLWDWIGSDRYLGIGLSI